MPSSRFSSFCFGGAFTLAAAASGVLGGPANYAIAASPVDTRGDIAVNNMPDAQGLVQDKVVDPNGSQLGEVADIRMDGQRATLVKVKLSTSGAGERAATIRADKLFYDRNRGVLVAELSPAQIGLLKQSATSTPGGGGPRGMAASHPTNY